MTNDPFIGLEFNKKDHIYTYKGQELESVTRFIEQFQKPFDREFWSKRKAKQEGITQEEMLKKWDDKSQLALACGTEVHEMIESFLKEELIEPHQDAMQRAANLFNGWRDWWLKRKQVETSAIEWRMFNEAWGIAGTADLLTKNRDEYILLDWKTNEKFSTDNKFDNLLSPFDQFQDCDLNKYSLQLSLYMLLAQKAGIPISSAWIIHISEKITAYKVWDHLFIHELERILDKRIKKEIIEVIEDKKEEIQEDPAQASLFDMDELQSWKKEWQGMPEFHNNNLTSVQQIIVHFKTNEDRDEFAKLIDQKITYKTKSLWYPKSNEYFKDKYWINES